MPRTGQLTGNVALLRALQLGDLLCSVPALRTLRASLPDSRITLVGLPWARSFVDRFNRYVDGFLEFPGYPGLPETPADEAKLDRFDALVLRERFDLAIQMHGDGIITNRFLEHLHARRLAGFYKNGEERPSSHFIPYPEDQPEIRRLLQLVEAIGCPVQGEHLEFPIREVEDREFRLLSDRHALPVKRYVCLHPGARHADRRWPISSFIALGRKLLDRGWHLLVTGTEGEREITRQLSAGLGICTDLTGATSLGVLACVLRSSRLLVCNDTGVSHLGAALGVPSVVIFSGSDPSRWAPLDTERHRALGDPIKRPGSLVDVDEASSAALSLLADALTQVRPVHRSSSLTWSTPIDWKRINRILALRLDNIGDVVLLGPALRALKAHLPGVHITLMASPAGSQAARLLGDVDDVWTEKVIWQDASFSMPLDPDRQLELVDRIRRGNFDLALIFSSFSQSPYPPAFACYLAGVPIRAGDSKEFGGSVLSHWVEAPEDAMHQAERNLNLLRAIGCPAPNESSRLELTIPEEDEDGAARLLAEAGIGPDQPFISVVPGASCAARTYPFARYCEVVRLLSERVACPLVLLGSAREAQSFLLADTDALPTSRVVWLVGRTTVAQFAAIVKRASVVVANNSSAVHIADAFSRPMVVLYSGTEYRSQWRPRFSLSRILTRPTPCSPCYQFQCPYQLECLEISPEEVCSEVVRLLELTSSPMEIEPSVVNSAQVLAEGRDAAGPDESLLVQEGQA